MERRRTIRPDLVVVLLAGTLSAIVIVVPGSRIELDSAAAGAILVTARGIAELFAACMFVQRFQRTATRADGAAAAGLGLMAVADVVFALGRATVAPDLPYTAGVMPYHLLGAALLAVAGFSAARPLVRSSRRRVLLIVGAVLALVPLNLEVAGLVRLGALADGHEPAAIVILRMVALALLTLAAAGFVRHRGQPRDPLRSWLSVALGLTALVHAQRMAVPAPAAAAFTWAHVLQLGATAALVRGCMAEIRGYQLALAELAVRDERRRMARDLHDGLAQEVAFIASQTKYLAGQTGDDRMNLIAMAAQRALDDSRFLVGTLRRATALPLSASIAIQAQEFARRWGLKVELTLQDDADVAPEKRQAVLRILGEALFNSARHGDASTVKIVLGATGGRLHLGVSDDGRGFEPDQIDGAGFGLDSMRERARLLGADLRLESKPGHGTRVEIAVP